MSIVLYSCFVNQLEKVLIIPLANLLILATVIGPMHAAKR